MIDRLMNGAPAPVRRADGRPHGVANFYPSPDQHRLLEALLLPAAEARAAAIAWLDAADLDALDPASRRLLPLLHIRLGALGVSHPSRARVQEEHRHAWSKDKRLRLQLAAVHRQLADAGITVILLKGLSLGLHAYSSTGLRPTQDLDLLVRHEDVAAAHAVLETRAWTYRPCYALHARNFVNANDVELDLHVSPYREAVSPEHVAGLWQRHRTVSTPAGAYAVMSLEDELLHTLAHGLCVSAVSPIRWIVDAVLLLRTGGRPDWDVLVGEAARLELSHVARQGLGYLNAAFGIDVPAPVLDALRRAASLTERVEYRLNRHGRQWAPLDAWMRLRRSGGTPRDRVRDFVGRYKRAWSTDDTAGLARRAAVRLILGERRTRHFYDRQAQAADDRRFAPPHAHQQP